VDLAFISDLDLAGLKQARTLYEEAFPIWERESFDRLLRDSTDTSARQLALLDDDTVVSIAMLSKLEAIDWWFLEYFATSRERRSQGLGGYFWGRISPDLGSPTVLEIEHPEEEGLDLTERTIRKRRRSFWEKNGFSGLAIGNFRVPRTDNGGDEPMELMTNRPESAASPDELRSLVVTIHHEGYGLPPSHELTKLALDSIG